MAAYALSSIFRSATRILTDVVSVNGLLNIFFVQYMKSNKVESIKSLK